MSFKKNELKLIVENTIFYEKQGLKSTRKENKCFLDHSLIWCYIYVLPQITNILTLRREKPLSPALDQ